MIKYIKKHTWIQSVLWVCIIVALWEISSTFGWTNQFLLPSFSNVVKELISQISHGEFCYQIVNSFGMIMYGLIASLIITSILVCLCVCSKVFKSFIKTLCTIFTPLPGVAVMPIIIMFCGISNKAMIALMLHSVMWPLIINLLGGINTIPQIYIDFGKNLEISKSKMVTGIYIFSVMPHIISGLKIAWGRAWRALISAEMVFGMIGELGGIGYFIYTNRAYGNMTRVMVGIVAVIVLGVIVEEGLFRSIERVTISKWRTPNE